MSVRRHRWRELDDLDRPGAVEAARCTGCGLVRVRFSRRAHHTYERRGVAGELLERLDRAPACTEST